MDISDTDSAAVLAELNQYRRRSPSLKALGIFALLLLTVGFLWAPFNLLLLAGLVTLHVWRARKTKVTLCYDLDAVAQVAWGNVRGTVASIAQANRLWRIQARAQVHDRKYHAGAGGLIQRLDAKVIEQLPPGIESNVIPVCLMEGNLAIYFFPDRVLIYQQKEIGGLAYTSVRSKAALTSFIEDERPPADARISGYTWQYLNRNGTPDKRFANNRQLPICEYDQLELQSTAGLNCEFHISRQGLAKGVAAALSQAGQLLREQVAQPRPVIPPPLPNARVRASSPPPLPNNGARAEAPTFSPTTRSPSPSGQSLSASSHKEPNLAPASQDPSSAASEAACLLAEELRAASRPAAPPPSPKPPTPPPPRPAKQPPRVPELQWIEPGQPVEFAGVTIEDGMVWWHESNHDLGEPSALSVYKAVSQEPAPPDEDLGYWPSYDTLSPAQRRSYLEWMAQGRRDSNPSQRSLGYVFLFFYGLERRLLIDGDTNAAIFEELAALLQHYGPAHRSYSLKSYFLQLLHFAGWKQGHEFYESLWPRLLALDLGRESEDALSLVTAHLHSRGKPLPWDLALRLAKLDPDSRNSVVVSRSGEKFEELFRHRYEKAFGAGLLMAPSKAPARIEYRPASMGLIVQKELPQHREKFVLKVPNVRGLSRQFKKLSIIWNSCIDDLSSYSRSLVAKQGRAVSTWEALPAELRGATPHPLADSLTQLLAGAPVERGFPLVDVGSLASMLELPQRPKLTQAQTRQLVETVRAAGYTIAPNPSFTAQNFAWDQAVALYPREEVNEEHLPGLIRFLYLSAAVASADGSLDDSELEVFNASITAEVRDEREWQHIRATEAAICRDSNVAVRALVSIADQVPAHARHSVLKSLLHVGAADGQITLDELRMLKRIARAFEINEEWIENWISENAREGEVVVQAAGKSAVQGEALPKRSVGAGAPNLRLDMDRIRALTQETHEVVTLLNEVMAEEEPAQSRTHPSDPNTVSISESVPPWFDGLPSRFHAPVLFLMTHDEVTADRFEQLARDHHLLPDDLLSSVNEWSDEKLGDFLLEKDDTVRIYRDLLPTS